MTRSDLLLLVLWLACCALLAHVGQEQVGAIQLPAGRDASVLPVLHDLKAVLLETKAADNLGGAAKLPNQGPIGVLFTFHTDMVHGWCTKSTAC
jgi:hypothetical protein